MRVELSEVGKSFGDVRALNGISLRVAPGERVALVGPNGSGKSTLIRAVMGIVRCDGEVRVEGRDPFRHRADLALRLAYVPQAAPQLGATAGEVVRAVAALRGLAVAEIRETATALDLDLEALRRRPVRALSGGTRQKLLIALALAAPASLLIMDEPTASLDADARASFLRLLEARGQGATLLLGSHRLDEVGRLVDRVVVLEEGRLAMDAPATAPGIARHLVGGRWWREPHDGALCLSGGVGR